MTIHDMEQYSPDWWAIRRGVPTASEFSSILTPKTGKLSAAADTYICRLIGDLYDPEYPRIDKGVNDAMREGTRREPESRRWYELDRALSVQQVGFCLTDDGRFGCSPDGLVGQDGVIELKNPGHAQQVRYLIDNTLPDDYRVQVHGQLLVTGRKWLDFMSYAPPLPPLLVRVVPDEFTVKLAAALEAFWVRFLEVRSLVADRELT